jgi:catechol 2,3-dioxygenase-like lactoylglutathione lyase family enzyme
MNRVKIITVLVLDQDEALEFCTRKLGFELREDKPFGESRWVTISLPKNRDLTLVLELAKTADDKAIVGKQGGSHAFLGLDTSDCIGDYTRMKPLGVKFLDEPQSGTWGTGVQCEDLCGNKIFMSQEP